MTAFIKNYVEPAVCRQLSSWEQRHVRPAQPFETHTHPARAWDVGADATIEPLHRLVERLTDSSVVDRFVWIREGCERRQLERDPLVRQLVKSLRREAGARRIVERFLDQAFGSLVPGQQPAATEATLALLFALKRADVAWAREILEAFATASAAEIGRLSRFATRLLANEL